jgi:hypothetical protein
MKKTTVALLLALAATSATAMDLNGTVRVGQANFGGEADTAVKIAVSHDYNEHLSAEVGYLHAGSFAGATASAVDVAAVGRYALADGLSVSGRLGVSRSFAHESGATSAGTGATYGVGLNYQAGRYLSTSLTFDQYSDFANSDKNLNVTMLGATYKF